jgi:hypothetical protein
MKLLLITLGYLVAWGLTMGIVIIRDTWFMTDLTNNLKAAVDSSVANRFADL